MSEYNFNCEAAADESQDAGYNAGFEAGYRAEINHQASDPRWMDRNNPWQIGYAEGYKDGIMDAHEELCRYAAEDYEPLPTENALSIVDAIAARF